MIYKHARVIRYFLALCVPFMGSFAIGSLFLKGMDTAPLWFALGFPSIFGLGALYAAIAFVFSFGWVRLDKNSITIKLVGTPQTVPYAEIVDVKIGQFFVVVGTQNGRFYIDRNIHNHLTLVRDLKRRIPNIQHKKENWITDPLPRQIPGKKSNYTLFIFFTCFFLAASAMFVYGLFDTNNWLKTGFGFFLALFFIALALLMIHEALWIVPFSIRFEADKIIIKHIIGQKIYDPADIATVQISTVLVGKQNRPSYHLNILFKSDEKLKLEIREAWFTEHVFQIMDLIVQHYNVDPVYKKQEARIRYHQFANGSKKPFPYYFERESQVPMRSREEIEHWLRGCAYLQDHIQFGQNDVWLHPVDFEQIRKGDCEDHALWAWRKLIDLNYTAEFVVGYMKNHFGDDGYHAWVTFEENGRSYLMETTAKNNQMIHPLESQTQKYRPLFSIDQQFKTYQF